MSRRNPITGHVARILSDREIAINRGSEHGVEVGIKFAVLHLNGEEILDPITKESLGPVDLAKVVLRVTQVKPKLCIASTFRKWTKPGGPFHDLTGFGRMSAPPETVIETLRFDDEHGFSPLSDEDSYVRIGDPVREVIGDEFSGLT